MAAVEHLRMEHHVTREALERLCRLTGVTTAAGSTRGPVDRGAPEELLNFLAQEIASHMAKEEETCFPLLARVIGREGPLATVEAQHHGVDETLEALVELAGAAHLDPEVLAEQAAELARRLEAHMSQEEELLFPMLESILDEAMDQELILRMNAIQQRFG